jgi:glycosyltransferase involved in cell wall biosynthesis
MVAADPEIGAIAERLARIGVGPAISADPRRVARSPAAVKKRPVICLVTSRKFATSQTFIAAHIQQLPADVRLVLRQDQRCRDEDDRSLQTVVERACHALAREFGYARADAGTRALARFLRKTHAAAVLAEFGHIGAEALPACRAVGLPLVVHFHGYEAYRRDMVEDNRQAYGALFVEAAAIVVVSEDMRRQLIALGARAERIVLNPCGVDTSRFQGADPAAAPPLFVAVGRLVDKKAPHLTLLAFAKTAAVVPEARLVICGEGTLMDACCTLAAAYGIADKVTFTGPLPHTSVAQLMRNARAFVQHSVRPLDRDSEGTPVSVLEAGSSGLPVVATAHAGIADVVVHGDTGYLVNEGDVDAMAAFMIALARDPERAGRIGRRARAHVSANYSMEQSLRTLWQVLEDAIASRTASAAAWRAPTQPFVTDAEPD